MLGAVVIHKIWGKGFVVEQTGTSIVVHFDIGDKKFVFPSAFDSFLSTDDAALLAQIAEQKASEAEKRNKLVQRVQVKPLHSKEKKPLLTLLNAQTLHLSVIIAMAEVQKPVLVLKAFAPMQ